MDFFVAGTHDFNVVVLERSELEQRIAEAERMKQVLELLMACECPTLDDCARGLRG